MSKSTICTIFMVLFLSQVALGKPSDSSAEKELSFREELGAFVGFKFIGFMQNYAEKCIKVSREILKDEDFLAHPETMIVEFKQNLTRFVDAFESSSEIKKKYDTLDMFTGTTDYYYEIPEDKYTRESKYIVDILNKYHYKDIESEMDKEFEPFVEQFTKIFEKHKSNLEKYFLDWYENFQRLTDFEEKLNALIEFVSV